MSDELPPPVLPPPPAKLRPIWLGLAAGLAPGLIGAGLRLSRAGGPLVANTSAELLITSLTLWPLAAVGLAIVRPTRRFGLGMLLGMGLSWLVMLALCGGRLW